MIRFFFGIILAISSGLSAEVFISTGHTNSTFERSGTGDVDYARVITHHLAAKGHPTHLIQGLYQEDYIYSNILNSLSPASKILHIMVNAPHTGMVFTQEGLESFRIRGGHVVATVVEFAKHTNRHDRAELMANTYKRLCSAESIIFLDEIDRQSALDNLNNPEHADYKAKLRKVLENSTVLSVPPTTPVITTPIENRGKNILVFGMIRPGKGFAHVLKLATLMKTDPALEKSKIIIVGTALDHGDSTEVKNHH